MLRMITVLGLIVILSGCDNSPLAKLESPEKLTLYSLDFRDPPQRIKSAETFRDYPVFGKVEILDPAKRKEIITRLKAAVRQGNNDKMAKCFWPRHGIRAVENGQTVDYVICFECNRFEEFVNEEKLRHKAIGYTDASVFNDPLKDAGVPIVPATGSPELEKWAKGNEPGRSKD